MITNKNRRGPSRRHMAALLGVDRADNRAKSRKGRDDCRWRLLTIIVILL